MVVQILLPGQPKRDAKSIRKIRQENPWCQSAMGPSHLHRGREARASPQSPEAQGLWKVLTWDLGRDSGGTVFTGRASGVGGAAAPTSCQNKDPDSECWVCPSGWPGMLPSSPNQGKATVGDRSAQAMGLQQPSWMCLPHGRPHLPPSLHADCPAWTLGDAQQPFHLVSSQANLPICYDLLFRNQNAKPPQTRWSEAGGWFWRRGLGLS